MQYCHTLFRGYNYQKHDALKIVFQKIFSCPNYLLYFVKMFRPRPASGPDAPQLPQTSPQKMEKSRSRPRSRILVFMGLSNLKQKQLLEVETG